MSEINKVKDLYKVSRSFKRLFFDENNNLTKDGEIVLGYLRDVCGGKGELEENGSSFLFSKDGHFDSGSAAYLLGRRRVFDLIIKNLGIDEVALFRIISLADSRLTAEERAISDISI